MDYKKLGELLKAARISAGYNQKEIATIIKKTFQNISSWELGKSKIDIENLITLCRLYNISFVETLLAVEHDDKFQIKNEFPITKNYNKLNHTGQKKADEYICDLLANPKYILHFFNDENIMVEAASEGDSDPNITKEKYIES